MEPEKKMEEERITQRHDKDSDIGAGRQIADPRSGTLSDRAGDEAFDDDTNVRIDGESGTSEDLDEL